MSGWGSNHYVFLISYSVVTFSANHARRNRLPTCPMITSALVELSSNQVLLLVLFAIQCHLSVCPRRPHLLSLSFLVRCLAYSNHIWCNYAFIHKGKLPPKSWSRTSVILRHQPWFKLIITCIRKPDSWSSDSTRVKFHPIAAKGPVPIPPLSFKLWLDIHMSIQTARTPLWDKPIGKRINLRPKADRRSKAFKYHWNQFYMPEFDSVHEALLRYCLFIYL